MRFTTSRFILFGLILATSLALNFTSPQTASATTDCSSAQQAAVSLALSNGDTSLAARASGLCSNPCSSISNFYVNWSSYLNSQYVESKILDAYRTCLANENAGGGGSGGGTKPCSKISSFTNTPTPVIRGTAKADSTMSVSEGNWTPSGASFEYQWYVGSAKIEGETSSKITLTWDLVGKKVHAKVTGSKRCLKTVSKSSKPSTTIKAGSMRIYKPSDFKVSVEEDGVVAYIRERNCDMGDGTLGWCAGWYSNIKWSVTGSTQLPKNWDLTTNPIKLPAETYTDGGQYSGKRFCLHDRTWNISVTFTPRSTFTSPNSPPVTISTIYTCVTPDGWTRKYPDFNEVMDVDGLNRIGR